MQKDLFGTATILPTQYQEKTDFLNKYKITLKLDQAIVAVIALLIIYVFVFSFGVESGKRYAMAEIRSERAKRERMAQELGEKIFAGNTAGQPSLISGAADAPAGIAVNSVMSHPAIQPQTAAPKAAVVSNIPVTASGKFSIQVITFTSKSAAEQMIKKLASNGYQGMILPSGKFLQVCVTGYETRESANLALVQLKAKGLAPKDAYIRTRS